jgi:prepilin-type processing-associated H-X9-DG protein
MTSCFLRYLQDIILFLILAGNLMREAIMNRQKGLTRVDIVVGIIVIAALVSLVYWILMPHIPNERVPGKRIVCLANLKNLQVAWELYANANDEKIVCGEAYSGVKGTNGIRTVKEGNEPYWTGDDVTDSSLKEQLSIAQQLSAIKAGALYQYIKSERPYHCPFGKRNEIRTYTIVESMNGTSRGLEGQKVDNIHLYIKRGTQIKSRAGRVVFIDVNHATARSFKVNYDKEQWQDFAPVIHSNGITLSFADGHAEFWRWKGKETITNGKLAEPKQDLQPTTADGLDDLHKFQTAVWGRLGYEQAPAK